MNLRTFLVVAALVAGGCTDAQTDQVSTVESPSSPSPPPFAPAILPPPLIPMPAIPEALRGCWALDDSDWPGERRTLLITATGLTLDGREARPEYIQTVKPTAVFGLFSAPEGNNRATVATALTVGETGDPPGQLVLHEGDAGSYFYSRCRR